MTGGSNLVADDVSEKLKNLLEKITELEDQFSSLKPKQQQIKAVTGEERMIDVLESCKEPHATLESGTTNSELFSHSCECEQTSDQCCKRNHEDNEHLKKKCHGKTDSAMTKTFVDLPENLSTDYLKDYTAIKQQFEVLYSESIEIFNSTNFTY